MREADGSQGDIASGFELGGEDDPCAIGSEGGFGGASSVGDQVGDPGEAGTIGMNGEQIGCFVAGCPANAEYTINSRFGLHPAIRIPSPRSDPTPARNQPFTSAGRPPLALGEGNSFGDDRWLTEA